MAKYKTTFNPSMRTEYPFLELDTSCIGSKSNLICKLCDGRFNIANGGRRRIKEHLNAQKHLKSLNKVADDSVYEKLSEDEDDDSVFKDVVDKCRCCFKSISDNQKFIRLNDQHIQKFFDLTQLDVSAIY